MTAWWIHFTDGTKACVEAPNTKAATGKAQAAAGKTVARINSLPYPSPLVIGTRETDCPAFCYKPEECVGRSTCPRDYACND